MKERALKTDSEKVMEGETPRQSVSNVLCSHSAEHNNI